MSEETGTILAQLNVILSRAYCDFIFINCTIHSGPSGIPGHSLYGNDKESFFSWNVNTAIRIYFAETFCDKADGNYYHFILLTFYLYIR